MFKLKHILLFLIVFLIISTQAQTGKKTIHKQYFQIPLPGAQEGARVILHTDSTFLNFGILKDVENQEVYVWYMNGNWKLQNGVPVFTFSGNINQLEYIKEIKTVCKDRLDYRMIDAYYEFVFEKGKDGTLSADKEKITDAKKNLSYSEMNPKSGVVSSVD